MAGRRSNVYLQKKQHRHRARCALETIQHRLHGPLPGQHLRPEHFFNHPGDSTPSSAPGGCFLESGSLTTDHRWLLQECVQLSLDIEGVVDAVEAVGLPDDYHGVTGAEKALRPPSSLLTGAEAPQYRDLDRSAVVHCRRPSTSKGSYCPQALGPRTRLYGPS